MHVKCNFSDKFANVYMLSPGIYRSERFLKFLVFFGNDEYLCSSTVMFEKYRGGEKL